MRKIVLIVILLVILLVIVNTVAFAHGIGLNISEGFVDGFFWIIVGIFLSVALLILLISWKNKKELFNQDDIGLVCPQKMVWEKPVTFYSCSYTMEYVLKLDNL